LKETLKEFMELVGQPTIPTSHELSLEETLEEFRKTVNQHCQEIIDTTVAKTKAVARLEGQFGHLVAEFNRIEEEEFQSQEMVRGQYMIDEDCPSNRHHEHV
jgi:arginine utilization protein RocB